MHTDLLTHTQVEEGINVILFGTWIFIHFIHKEETSKRSHSFTLILFDLSLGCSFLSNLFSLSLWAVLQSEQTQLCAFVSWQAGHFTDILQKVGTGQFCKNVDYTKVFLHLMEVFLIDYLFSNCSEAVTEWQIIVMVIYLKKMLLISHRKDSIPQTLTCVNMLLSTGGYKWLTSYCVALNFNIWTWIVSCRIRMQRLWILMVRL